MDANEKNLSVAMNLLEGILAKSRFEKDGTKNYSIYFPVFDEENGKILAKFPVFEIDGMEATLKGWQVYNLDDYRLDVFLIDNQNIVYDDYNTVNYRNPEDQEKLLYFINIFLKVQEFKKTGRGIDVVPENKTVVENLIGDFENNIVDNISEDVNRIYNYEIEYEDDDTVEDNSILDSIDSLDDYEDELNTVPETVEDDFEEVEEIEEDTEDETMLPGMNFEEDDEFVVDEEETVEDTDETMLPGMNFEEDDEFVVDEEETVEDTEDETMLPGMNFEEDDEFVVDEEETVEDTEDETILPGMNFEEDDEFVVDEEDAVEDTDETILPGMGFDDDFENDTTFETTNDLEGLEDFEVPGLNEDTEEEETILPGMSFEEDDEIVVEDEEETVEETEDILPGMNFEDDEFVVEDEDEDEVEETFDDVNDLDDVEVETETETEKTILPELSFDEETNEFVVEDVENTEDSDDEFEDLDGFEDDEEDDYDDIPTIDDLERLADEENFENLEEVEEIDETEEVEESFDDVNDLDDLEFETEDTNLEDIFELVVGMDSIKEKVLEYQKYVSFVKNMNLTTADLNMAFVGNKGTGKSVIASVITEMLYDMDMIAANKLTKVNKKELCSGPHHKGHAIDHIIDAAMGGVLLIDEACRCDAELSPELTARLVDAMDAGLIVIFAGCNEGMNRFLNMNKDVASKVVYTFEFPDYTAEELENIVKFKAEFEGLTLDADAEKAISTLMNAFDNAEGVDSRFTRKVFQKMVYKHSSNLSNDITLVVKEDVPTVNEMLDFVPADDKKVVSEVVKAVYTANTKLIVVKDNEIAVLKAKENNVNTKASLLNKITSLLVGMAAEEVYFGETNNNVDDLRVATHIARHLVHDGMSDLGLATINKHEIEMTKVVYDEVNKILAKCMADAKAYVTKNKKNLDNVIEYVRKHNEIDGTTIFKEFENKKEEKVAKVEKVVKTEKKVQKETKPAKAITKKEVAKKEPAKKTTKTTKVTKTETKTTKKTKK